MLMQKLFGPIRDNGDVVIYKRSQRRLDGRWQAMKIMKSNM